MRSSWMDNQVSRNMLWVRWLAFGERSRDIKHTFWPHITKCKESRHYPVIAYQFSGSYVTLAVSLCDVLRSRSL